MPPPEPEHAVRMSDEEAAAELQKFRTDPECAEALAKWQAMQERFGGHTCREDKLVYQMLSESELAERRKVLLQQAQQIKNSHDTNR